MYVSKPPAEYSRLYSTTRGKFQNQKELSQIIINIFDILKPIRFTRSYII